MATAVTDVEAVPVSYLTFYCSSRDGGKNLSLYTPYRALFCHRSPSREDTTRSVPHDLGDSALSARCRPILDPASTQPQSTAGRQGGKADVAQDSGSLHRLVPDVTMVSRDGRPFLGHVPTATSTGIDKKLHLKAPRHLGLLLPYKRAGQGSSRGNEARHKPEAKRQQAKAHNLQINVSSNLPCTLTFPLRPGFSSLSRSL
jgi:hypothetical protein